MHKFCCTTQAPDTRRVTARAAQANETPASQVGCPNLSADADEIKHGASHLRGPMSEAELRRELGVVRRKALLIDRLVHLPILQQRLRRAGFAERFVADARKTGV